MSGGLSDAERARLLLECWWSHDGQWFLKARSALGLGAAMALNEDAIESMGRIEMRRLHAALGAPPVRSVSDFMPLVLEAHRLVGFPAEGAMDGPDALVVSVEGCRVWEMTIAAGMQAPAPGCRGSLRRRRGWASVFFDPERVLWTRERGLPDGDPSCAYRMVLGPGQGSSGRRTRASSARQRRTQASQV